MAKPQRPAIYVRISDDRDGESLGVERQLADCEKLVKQHGWPQASVYNDNDRSAWKRNAVRPDFRRLLGDIEAGLVDAVVVYDSDRFYRQPRELEQFLEIAERAGVSTFAQVGGAYDLGSTDGRLTLRVKAAVAVKESDDKSRRIKRKALELAEAGKIGGGGTRPFGFEQDRLTIRASEAATIIELAERVLAGESIRSLCLDLNRRGIETTTGKAWVPRVLTRMLQSGRISGQREHLGQIVADAEWPAIVSVEEGRRLRAVLSDPSRRKNEQVRRYLLAGMLRCGRCGEPLQSRPRVDGKRRYVCAHRPGSEASCGRLAVMAEDLEALVVEAALQRLEGPELARAFAARNGDGGDAHQREIDEVSERLEELARFYGERQISGSEWMAARTPLEDRLRLAKAGLARSNGTSAVAEFVGQGSALRTSWDALPLSRQRAILSAVFESATIGPAVQGRNTFDPERVTVTWRE